MKKLILALILFSTFFLPIYSYSLTDVSSHNSSLDCWAVFEGQVYDLTEYLQYHDSYLDIREWCGKDMTEDFITKAGTGADHKTSSYVLLEQYLIGEIDAQIIQEAPKEISISSSEDELEAYDNPYNLIIPLLLSLSIYWMPYLLIRKKILSIPIKAFNAFWNSLLFILLFVPALGFGILMILRYKFPQLWDIDFDFLYWHVELSLVMGILAINHFIQRIKIYFSQLRN